MMRSSTNSHFTRQIKMWTLRIWSCYFNEMFQIIFSTSWLCALYNIVQQHPTYLSNGYVFVSICNGLLREK